MKRPSAAQRRSGTPADNGGQARKRQIQTTVETTDLAPPSTRGYGSCRRLPRRSPRRSRCAAWQGGPRAAGATPPASVHSARRRQHVMPDPKPSSCGRCSQQIPVCSTNRMSWNTSWSGCRLRPGQRARRSAFGSSGSITDHSSSSASHGFGRATPHPRSSGLSSGVLRQLQFAGMEARPCGRPRPPQARAGSTGGGITRRRHARPQALLRVRSPRRPGERTRKEFDGMYDYDAAGEGNDGPQTAHAA